MKPRRRIRFVFEAHIVRHVCRAAAEARKPRFGPRCSDARLTRGRRRTNAKLYEAVKASEASAKLSADSAVSALEATKLILARAESLEDSAKKADSLN